MGFESVKLDDGFDALPAQDKARKVSGEAFPVGERVPEPPHWMSWAQRYEYYRKDLVDFLGDYAGGIELMPMICNFPKRSSRPEKKKRK